MSDDLDLDAIEARWKTHPNPKHNGDRYPMGCPQCAVNALVAALRAALSGATEPAAGGET